MISRQYRGAIRECLQLLAADRGAVSTAFTLSAQPAKQALHAELVSAELLWSLFEAVVIRPGGNECELAHHSVVSSNAK